MIIERIIVGAEEDAKQIVQEREEASDEISKK